MRNRIAICLAAAATAACSGATNDNATNGANVNVANAPAPAPGNEAVNAQPASNEVEQAVREGPPPSNASHNASGTEPFWTLAIGNGQMNYEYPGGGVGAETPEPTPVRNGFEFRTPLLTARFIERPCTEVSGQTMRYTVRVTAEGRIVNGCGR